MDMGPGYDREPRRKRPEELRLQLHPIERCAPEAGDWLSRVQRLVAGGFVAGSAGTVKAHGSPQDRWWTEPNRDYPGDTSLFWETGNTTHEMRLTPGDIEQIRIQLSAAPPSPATVIAWLAGMAAHLESDVADQAAVERVIRLVRRHYLKEDV